MLFKQNEAIKVVSSCPVVKASKGVMEFPPELVAAIAGAVLDKIEWMVLLLGERSEDGFQVKVTGFRVPQQRRTSNDVSMTEPMEADGSTIGEDVVGVLHSHHSLGAFFSHTDNTELNPQFKSSIVVSQGSTTALGFKYKAEGKVVLPCGSVGKVDFQLVITGTRWTAEVVREHDGKGGFGDCEHVTESVEKTDDELVESKTTAFDCALIDGTMQPLQSVIRKEKPRVFGVVGGEQLLDEIRKMTTGYSYQSGHYGQQGGYAYERRTSVGNGQQGVFSPAGHGSGSFLSRKKRKRLRREGKLSASRGGLYSVGSSDRHYNDGPCPQFTLPDGKTWEHGMECKVCKRTRFMHGDESAADPASTFVRLPHTYASSWMSANGRRCESCTNLPENATLYLYVGKRSDWRAWMCADCYDMFMDDADGNADLEAAWIRQEQQSAGEQEEDSELCRKFAHVLTVIKGVFTCMTCADAATALTEAEARKGMRERLGMTGLLLPAPIIH